MKTTSIRMLVAAVLVCVAALIPVQSQAAEPLPSWNDTATKKTIVAFVEKVTRDGSPDFVPAAEGIATFDRDSDKQAIQIPV